MLGIIALVAIMRLRTAACVEWTKGRAGTSTTLFLRRNRSKDFIWVAPHSLIGCASSVTHALGRPRLPGCLELESVAASQGRLPARIVGTSRASKRSRGPAL